LGEVPQSGRHLISTLRSRFASSGVGSAESDRPKSIDVPPVGEVGRPSGRILEQIEESSYLDAILGMGVKVARGLHHAHERGIIHRDLKPANILITDDAQPMILDFNLAEDHKIEPELRRIRFGGTIPYMSPEQLESYQGHPVPIDRRSDVYALGVILIQLTTGVYPFPPFEGGSPRVVPQILESRRRGLPAPRKLNPAISSVLEAIMLKAIAPNPDDRYRTAQELAEDLDRQRTRQAEKSPPEPALGEWLQQWRRRPQRGGANPTRACLAASVFLASLAAFVGSSPGSPQRESRHRREEIGEQFRESSADTARDSKRTATNSRSLVARGVARLPDDPRAALADFQEAERLSPRAIEPIRHQAHVLAEYLHDDCGALECMNRLLRAHPNCATGRVGRAGYLARVGEIDEAIRDARAALDLYAGPEIQYLAACVYALAAAKRPEYRPEALALLSQALQRGYGHQHLRDDGDLDSLRNDPDFEELLSYVNKLRDLQRGR
jgi:tetratricopeptide (TPR) repeat protein